MATRKFCDRCDKDITFDKDKCSLSEDNGVDLFTMELCGRCYWAINLFAHSYADHLTVHEDVDGVSVTSTVGGE